VGDFFVDTSALTKRYVEEDGSEWLSNTCDDKANVIYIAAVTRVEMLAGLTRRGKGGLMSSTEATAACGLFRADLKTDYLSIDVNTFVIDRAADLAEKYALRGYDAVQLAATIEANLTLAAAGLPLLTLVSSDREMNAAAMLEGLSVDDPVNHK
jgi:uncharacterized protein